MIVLRERLRALRERLPKTSMKSTAEGAGFEPAGGVCAPPGGAPRCPPHGGQAERGWFFVPPCGRLLHAARRHLLPAERASGVCSLLFRAELSARFRAGVLAGLKAGR